MTLVKKSSQPFDSTPVCHLLTVKKVILLILGFHESVTFECINGWNFKALTSESIIDQELWKYSGLKKPCCKAINLDSVNNKSPTPQFLLSRVCVQNSAVFRQKITRNSGRNTGTTVYVGDIDIKRETENGSPGEFPYIRLPFAHRANGSLSFVCLLTKKQMQRLNGLNGLAHLCR